MKFIIKSIVLMAITSLPLTASASKITPVMTLLEVVNSDMGRTSEVIRSAYKSGALNGLNTQTIMKADFHNIYLMTNNLPVFLNQTLLDGAEYSPIVSKLFRRKIIENIDNDNFRKVIVNNFIGSEMLSAETYTIKIKRFAKFFINKNNPSKEIAPEVYNLFASLLSGEKKNIIPGFNKFVHVSLEDIPTDFIGRIVNSPYFSINEYSKKLTDLFVVDDFYVSSAAIVKWYKGVTLIPTGGVVGIATPAEKVIVDLILNYGCKLSHCGSVQELGNNPLFDKLLEAAQEDAGFEAFLTRVLKISKFIP